MTIAWKIHWVDIYGQASVEMSTREGFEVAYNGLMDSPDTDDVWVEYLDDEEGWMA